MKLNYLREFVVLSDELSFSSAASKLFISQSTLSRHVSILEAALGGKLLDRNTHSVKMTPFGIQTALKCRELLRQYDDLFSDNKEMSEQLSGDLSVGMLYYGIAEYYGDFLNQFNEKYPRVRLHMSNLHPNHLYHAVVSGSLDIGDMIFAKAFMNENIVFHKLYPHRVIAMLPENHPLAQKDSISLREAANETLIDLQEDAISSICTQEIIRKCGVVFKNVQYTMHIETVPTAILRYNGIHITGDRVKHQAYPGIKYLPISDSDAFTYHCFIHRSDNPNKLIPVFINEAHHFFREKSGAV